MQTIGNGHGGIVSQLKYDNEMKLTDEYWINYQKGKGSEEFQKYMEDLTDMQNHVLPYLQSFCNLEEKGVKERREQQIAERYEGRADERVTSTEANEVVKDVGKTDRKPAQQKQAVDGKDKKLSIHERLEINKRIIQEKQGKDKTERGVDLGVRTVQNKQNESEVMDDNVASGFIAYCRKNYKWYNECKCDKRMSPVMRLPNEKSVLF